MMIKNRYLHPILLIVLFGAILLIIALSMPVNATHGHLIVKRRIPINLRVSKRVYHYGNYSRIRIRIRLSSLSKEMTGAINNPPKRYHYRLYEVHPSGLKKIKEGTGTLKRVRFKWIPVSPMDLLDRMFCYRYGDKFITVPWTDKRRMVVAITVHDSSCCVIGNKYAEYKLPVRAKLYFWT